MKPSFLKSIAIVLTLAVAPLTISTAQAVVKLGSYFGNWKPGITYGAGDLITYSNKTFISLVAKNKAKNPNSNPKFWQVLGGGGADGVGVIGPQGLKGDTGQAVTGSFTYSNTCGLSGTDACKIGAVGPGGGWIFFVDYNDQYLGFTYLEAAPTDIADVSWCNHATSSIPEVSDWTARGVGKGQANTTAMLGVCSAGAANEAESYLTQTKSDWFLPSFGEVKLMYNNLLEAGVGGFAVNNYWSSTESGSGGAWSQNFSNTNHYSDGKYNSNRVRAVRAF
jgi:hypothetical protein